MVEVKDLLAEMESPRARSARARPILSEFWSSATGDALLRRQDRHVAAGDLMGFAALASHHGFVAQESGRAAIGGCFLRHVIVLAAGTRARALGSGHPSDHQLGDTFLNASNQNSALRELFRRFRWPRLFALPMPCRAAVCELDSAGAEQRRRCRSRLRAIGDVVDSGQRGRPVGLVTWNDGLTEGLGRSGSRYRLVFRASFGGRRARSVADRRRRRRALRRRHGGGRVRRAEGLEAIRCIIRGSSAELNEDQLQYAEIIAREMMEAADQALATAPSGDRTHLMQSSRSLRSVSEAIRRECTRREREDGPPVLPLPH